MRFRDVTSLALRGLPSKCLVWAPPQAVTHQTDRSTRPGPHILRGACVSATGRLWLVLDDSHRRVPTIIRERCKHLHAINSGSLSWLSRILLATSRSEYGTPPRFQGCDSRACLTRHLPLPTFLASSGVCSSEPLRGLVSYRCHLQDFQH